MDVVARIKGAQELLKDGVLSEQEFERTKAAILDSVHGKVSSGSGGKKFGEIAFSEKDSLKLAETLNQDLPRDMLKKRPGPGGRSLTYLESWQAIDLANGIFGSVGGWSDEIVSLTTESIEQHGRNWEVVCSAIVRVTLRDGTSHSDCGTGSKCFPKKGDAIEMASKEAVSDARKRALKNFGRALGNCIYDKTFLNRGSKRKLSGESDRILRSHSMRLAAAAAATTTTTTTAAAAATTTGALAPFDDISSAETKVKKFDAKKALLEEKKAEALRRRADRERRQREARETASEAKSKAVPVVKKMKKSPSPLKTAKEEENYDDLLDGIIFSQ
eukprot:g2118.t1